MKEDWEHGPDVVSKWVRGLPDKHSLHVCWTPPSLESLVCESCQQPRRKNTQQRIYLNIIFRRRQLTISSFMALTSVLVAVCAQSRPTLCNSRDYSPPGSSAHGISQARILEWVAISSSRGSSQPRDRTHVSCGSSSGKQILYHCLIWEARY